MPRDLISDAHEWSDEIPGVPSVWDETTAKGTVLAFQRGKKTLLSLTLAWRVRGAVRACEVGAEGDHWRAVSRASWHVGSLAGAARLLESNAAVLGRAQRGGKPRVEQKGRSMSEQQLIAGAVRETVAWGSPVRAGVQRGDGKVTTGITGL